MTLTDREKLTPLWAALEGHLKARLATLRAKNDAPMSEAETAVLRGRIAEVKAFLSLGDERPAIDE